MQYKPSTVIPRLVGAGETQTVCGRGAGAVRAREAAELLVDAVYGRRARAPGSIHLRFLAISIIFGAKLYSVHILLVIFAILHRKNERLFSRGQFG